MDPTICWKVDQIHQVMDTDALHVPRHIFLATHHPIKMYKQTAGTKVQNVGTPYDEVTFLKDFMDKKEQIFVPILGESGTGKSHLVRWLEAQIDKQGRKVLLIPRLTNLKEIILKMLDGLEDPIFEEYRQRVRHSAGSVSFAQAKEMLLNNITLAIGPNGNHPIDRLDDYELHLMDNLPHLFRDPSLIPEWFKEGGVIHQLADNIVGGSSGRLNERREFKLEDLPLDLKYIDRASKDAMSIYMDLVGDNELQKRAVDWINRNLDQAISSMLSLSGTDLVKLMNHVRAALARSNIELVLLIEDFTILQGIDYQLLDALIYKAADNAGEERLCDMRVALGCTTGYFQRFEDTILTRIDFRVTLDVDEDLVPQEDVTRFAAKYLNALRVPEKDIQQWFAVKAKGNPLRSACEDCALRERCHAAFGEADGIGLYPFNRTAIRSMYKRSTKEERFNPRLMISKVLRHVMENYADPIREGNFPSPALYDHLGGKTENRLQTMVKTEIERKDPVNADRRLALIELWTEEYEAVDLHPYVHESFRLPPLQVRQVAGGGGDGGGGITRAGPGRGADGPDPEPQPGPVKPAKPIKPPESAPGPGTALPTNVETRIRALDSWVNEGTISQNHTRDFRELVYGALNDYIQWDLAMVNVKWFQDNGLWRAGSINFEGQSTQHSTGNIKLNFPVRANERKDTALVLQGLIYFNHYKHWEFKQGPEYLRFVSRYLERWSEMLLRQLRNIPIVGQEWDPLPASIEILAIAAAMGGHADAADPETLTSVLFEPIEPQAKRTSEWEKVYSMLLKHREDIQSFTLSRLAIIKGESASRSRLVDASQIYDTVAALQLERLTSLPKDKVGVFDPLSRSSDALGNVNHAVTAELQANIAWADRMTEAFGDDLDVVAAVNQLYAAYNSAASSASVRGGESLKIQAAIAGLASKPVGDMVGSIRGIDTSSLLRAAARLGRIPVKQIAEVTDSLAIVETFLSASSAKVDNDLNLLRGNAAVQELQSVKNKIGDQLEMMIKGWDSI